MNVELGGTKKGNINLVKKALRRCHTKEGTQEIPMIGLYTLEVIFEEEGWETVKTTGEETNGFEIDFWYHWTNPKYPGLQLTVSGALWQSGDTYNMYIDEKDTA